MKRIIGLTGGIAAGKSTVSKYLEEKGIPIIDADLISRELCEPGRPGYQMIVQEFGPSFLNPDGTLNRRELGKHVFSKPSDLERLEAILHPLILWHIQVKLQKVEGTVVIDAPLLHKGGLDVLCTEVWVVTAADDMRVKRILERDRITKEEAMDRLKNQIPQEELEARADVVLRNNGEPNDLYRQIDEVLNG